MPDLECECGRGWECVCAHVEARPFFPSPHPPAAFISSLCFQTAWDLVQGLETLHLHWTWINPFNLLHV